MFERFTDRSRRVVVLAQEEARLMRHAYIGTEHLLLGLIHEGEGVAAKALADLGVSLTSVREHVEDSIGIGPDGELPAHLPFTPRCKTVLELSLREALQLGHNYIGTEHLLLAVGREGQGIAVQILARHGVELALLRYRVMEMLAQQAKPTPPRFLRSPEPNPTYLDAALPGVAALIDSGWTLVERVVGPTVCPECNQPHTCDRYREVEATP